MPSIPSEYVKFSADASELSKAGKQLSKCIHTILDLDFQNFRYFVVPSVCALVRWLALTSAKCSKPLFYY